jgi:hypothetical protein
MDMNFPVFFVYDLGNAVFKCFYGFKVVPSDYEDLDSFCDFLLFCDFAEEDGCVAAAW